MHVLIVEDDPALGLVWARHLERFGVRVVLTQSHEEAVQALTDTNFEVIVMNLLIEGGSAMALADFASYRQPKARVIFVTNTSFFSDGSIFQYCANAAALVPSTTPPEDLAALVEHHAATGTPASRP
ncbi:response regulator [Marinovum sp. 2_MG-2023]|uniref:response regulator transcription factor n=1 Tax=Roseobacteraceae TaxID=2854170 RepID=UPI001FD5E433|nr:MULTISPECIES: response regulator [Roseobacteraceae]MCJ7871813.1 response regulator [Phaeobacter sp. J2-8]MDO6728657.1 response regulator [Marinovum sp. 2_MG-2023]MDO6777927.1 response regulator [Marinovum sp. 1_MG-2023]